MNVIRPPFTFETATAKVRAAEDAWNSREPQRVSLAYSEDSEWRNRDQFLQGRDQIRELLTAKWERELDYRRTVNNKIPGNPIPKDDTLECSREPDQMQSSHINVIQS